MRRLLYHLNGKALFKDLKTNTQLRLLKKPMLWEEIQHKSILLKLLSTAVESSVDKTIPTHRENVKAETELKLYIRECKSLYHSLYGEKYEAPKPLSLKVAEKRARKQKANEARNKKLRNKGVIR